MRKTLIMFLLATCLVACRKEPLAPITPYQGGDPPPANPPVANTTTTQTVTVDQTRPLYAIPADFEGLSYETRILTKNPDVLNANNRVLVQLLKNLGPGVLRIGGDTSDETEWGGSPRSATSPDNVLCTSDVDRLAAFSSAIGWPVMFGLNLGNNNATQAASEAAYAYKTLGTNLYALQAGNEPDIYHLYDLRTPAYDAVAYEHDWLTYFAAIKAQTPDAVFSGPDISYNTDYVDSFVGDLHGKVKLVDAHYYLTGPATLSYINYKTILARNTYMTAYLQKINFSALQFKLPYRITETNNVYGGGKAGTSDVFASALWALDLMWTIADNNGKGINFHGGMGLFYSPVAIQDNAMVARPEYYAMLAFKYGSTGATTLPTSVLAPQNNCSAHAAIAGNRTSITLINKEDAIDIKFTVQLSNKAGTIQVSRLQAPAINATDGTTYAGSTVKADGSFTPTKQEQYTVNSKSFNLTVPAGSAAVITVQ